MSDRDYYCSKKFRNMKIDAERKLTYHCDPAVPHNIDFDWLEKNPGQLFNNPLVVYERQQMLNNERNASCEQCCWAAEDVGAVSPRIIRQGYIRVPSELVSKPEIIDFTLGSDCNLTCSYCLKEYSSAWRQDLIANGTYQIDTNDDRYTLNNKDLIINKISQSEKLGSKTFSTLLKELELVADTLKSLIITGGEPFLHNSISELIEIAKVVPKVEIFTGCGVENKRFSRIIEKIKQYTNISIAVSAEATGKFYEFNRYGSSWNNFLIKLDILNQNNVNYRFHSTLSNLTVIDFVNFKKTVNHNHGDVFDLVYQPNFMAVYVLDDHTKQQVIDSLNQIELEDKEKIITSITVEPSDEQRKNIKIFLQEFTRRRPDLDVTIYPIEFLKWINYVV